MQWAWMCLGKASSNYIVGPLSLTDGPAGGVMLNWLLHSPDLSTDCGVWSPMTTTVLSFPDKNALSKILLQVKLI
jgi:hypothetical protein